MHETTVDTSPRLLPYAPASAAPFISVLLPVRNEAAFIEETLERLVAQDYDPDRFEILVADGLSTDRTRTIVAAVQEWHPNVHLLENPQQWSSAGRNVCLRAARGDLFVLVDGHCELDNPHYLTAVADAFARSGADCLGRPQPLDVRDATLMQRAIAAGRASRLGHHPDSHIYSDREGFVPPESVAVAYRRSVFEKVGLFDECFDACEDVELNHRVARSGLRCFFTPAIGVRYFPRTTLGDLFKQMVRYGRGRVRLLRKHRETFSLRGFVPAAFLAGAALGPALACLLPALWILYGGTLGFYALLVLSFSIAIARRENQPRMLGLLPAIFVTIHAGAGWGIWRECLRLRGPRHFGQLALPPATTATRSAA